MYSLVFLIYCNLMFILGCTCVMSCPNVPIGRIYNVNKSCQVIVGNPPIVYGLKSPQFQGTRVIRISQRGRTQQGFIHVENQYKQRVGLSIYHTLTHTQLQFIVEEEEDIGASKKEVTAVDRSSYCFGIFYLVLILSLRKLWGFLHLCFSQGKTLCSFFLVFYCCACYSLS